MSKRKFIGNVDSDSDTFPPRKEVVVTTLPRECIHSVIKHYNTIYTNSLIRVWNDKGAYRGQLCRVHTRTSRGLLCSIEGDVKDDNVLRSIDIRNCRWVVCNHEVMYRAWVIWKRDGTDDILNDNAQLTTNERKRKASECLMNDVSFHFPSKKERESYDCYKYALTCNCGYSMRVKSYTVSPDNEANAGKLYYGCANKFIGDSCNFFVWKKDLDHNQARKCECGKLAKTINVNRNNTELLPSYRFVCVNYSDRYIKGCKMYENM